MIRRKTTKTCVTLMKENAKILDEWSEETGLNKSTIINHLIEEAYKNGRKISVTYELKGTSEK